MRHVKVYNVWYDYHLFPNILPRQVLLYLIYHERVHSLLSCPVWRLWVLRGARPRQRERERERERETSSWALSPLSWAVLCTAHYTVQADTAGLGHWGVSDTELARPETRGCHLSCLQSTDNICCSSPGLGCCDSVCDLVWRNVTVWQVSHMTRRLSGKSILTVALFIKHNHNKDDKVFRQIGI